MHTHMHAYMYDRVVSHTGQNQKKTINHTSPLQHSSAEHVCRSLLLGSRALLTKHRAFFIKDTFF